MDSVEDLNRTIDLTANSSSDEDDENPDVIVTDVVEAPVGSTKGPIPTTGAANTETQNAPRTILIAQEVNASKFVDHNLETYNSMRAGDLVEFHRGLYTHWGVAIGNGKIIHLSGDDGDGLGTHVGGKLGSISGSVFTISGVSFDKAKVRCDDFWDVARESKADVNNSKDEYIRADAEHVIVKRALSRLGNIGYNMLWSNCEHFASWCRYGMAWSEQVDKFMRVIDRGKSIFSSTLMLLGITPRHMRPYQAPANEDGDETENSASPSFPQLDYFR